MAMALRVRFGDHTPLLLISMATICFFLLTTLPKSHCQEHFNKYSECSQPFSCGQVSDISYPFLGPNRPDYCGIKQFKLKCQPYPSFEIDSQTFKVLEIDTSAYTMKMARTGLSFDDCSNSSRSLTNTNFNPGLFRYTQPVHNITIIYDCPDGYWLGLNYFPCKNNGSELVFYGEEEELQMFPELQECQRRIQVPVLDEIPPWPDGGIDALMNAAVGGFEVKYNNPHYEECGKCMWRKGVCGAKETDNNQFSCYCPDGSDAASQGSAPASNPRSMPSASNPNHSNKGLRVGTKVSLGVASAVLGALVVGIAFYIHQRRKKNGYAMSYVQSQNLSSDPSLKDTEKGSRYLGVHLFTYSELEEATNYFDSARELGDGGFGTVYFGKS